jgi:hypothetical protein
VATHDLGFYFNFQNSAIIRARLGRTSWRVFGAGCPRRRFYVWVFPFLAPPVPKFVM